MTKILLIQGPNMAYLGRREPEIYGTTTAAELDAMLEAHAARRGYALEIMYTHIEGEAIARIYQAVDDGTDMLVMNPAGMTYAGYALRDCLKAVAPELPYIEVHIGNLEARGMRSIPGEAAAGIVAGLGVTSYFLALEAALERAGNPPIWS
jgi:3-dehydroquinate dehydratase-2